MRVLLLNPPRANEIVGNNPSIIEEERGLNPPLGILYLAGYLEQHTSHDVAVLDSQVERLDYPQLRDRVEGLRPEVVGITVMSFTLIDVIKSIAIVKEACPEAKIVLGGPHVHLYPTETIALDHVDCLVLGEGEGSFARLLECIDDPAALHQVPGLVFRDNGAVVQTAAPSLIEDLDALPFPARHLVPYRKYNSLLTKGDVATTVFTSRGCPFKCRFCDRPHLGHRFRARSPQSVVDELEVCVKMGIEDFLIYDDTFTSNRQRAKDICDEIVRRNLDIGFDIRARVDTIDEELVLKLKQAGCTGIHYGVEAGTERVLKVLNKGITISQVQQAFAMTRKQGIAVLAYFMIGNPTETLEEIQTTFSVMRSLRPDFVHLTILTPFPGTQVYEDALERGIIDRDVWREFAANPTAEFTPPHWGEHFTREELSALLIKGYRSFYLRPFYIMRRLAKLRSYGELKRKARAGLKVLGMK
jgi:radical SAM superfamily enzyme YgiQ (UPF0313 family)